MHQSATYLTEFVGAPCYSTLLRIDPNDGNKLLPDLAEKSTFRLTERPSPSISTRAPNSTTACR